MDPGNLDSILVPLQHAMSYGTSAGPLARGRRLPADRQPSTNTRPGRSVLH
jgi:hypothetical protein